MVGAVRSRVLCCGSRGLGPFRPTAGLTTTCSNALLMGVWATSGVGLSRIQLLRSGSGCFLSFSSLSPLPRGRFPYWLRIPVRTWPKSPNVLAGEHLRRMLRADVVITRCALPCHPHPCCPPIKDFRCAALKSLFDLSSLCF